MLRFAPDADPRTPEVLLGLIGGRVTARGYAAYLSVAEMSHLQSLTLSTFGTLDNAAKVIWGAQMTGGTLTARLYAASDTQIVQLTSSSGIWGHSDVSNATPYTITSPPSTHAEDYANTWAFTTYGTIALATNKAASPTTIQKQTTGGSAFTNLSASPKAATIETFKDFIVVGNVGDYGAVTGTNDMVAWSALGDYTSWVPSAATQAGNQRLTDSFGPITCIKRFADNIIVYKGRAIYIGTYVDNVTLFSFERISDKIGCRVWADYPPAIVDIGNAHIFIGVDDIYYFDGTRPISITEGVREFIRAVDGPGHALAPCHVVHDPLAGEVYFWDYGLVYNYRYARWGAVPAIEGQSVVGVFTGGTSGTLTLEDGYAPVQAPNTMYCSTNKKIFNRYVEGGSTPAIMEMVTGDQGSNEEASVAYRATPLFNTPPLVSGTTATHNYSNALGVSGGADISSIPMSSLYRFDFTAERKWHRMLYHFVSDTNPCEVVGLNLLTRKAGRE
jgi:hypothetical protein